MKYLLTFLILLIFFITGCGDADREQLEQTPNDQAQTPATKAPKSADGIFTAGDDQNVLEGDSVVLDMSIFDKDKEFIKYTWKNEDEIIGINTKLELENLPAGKHHISLEAEDSDGNIYKDTISIIIKKEDENNTAPLANNLTFILNEDETYKGFLSGSDENGDNLSYLFVSQPTHGKLRGSAANLRYIPDANFNGEDSFLYKTNDGTIDSQIATANITVSPINDTPVANEQNTTTHEDTIKDITLMGTDVDDDTLTFIVADAPNHGDFNGTHYTPDLNYNGVDSFTFYTNDGTIDSQIATVNIVVNPINDIPIANIDSHTIREDENITISVLKNDTDVDTNSSLTLVRVDSPAIIVENRLFFDTNNSYNYLKKDENITLELKYEMRDEKNASASSTSKIKITGENDKPVANNDFNYTDEDTSIVFNILTNDTDADNNHTLTLIEVNTTQEGVTFEQNGSITFSPIGYFDDMVANEERNVTFTYTIKDEHNETSQADAIITIIGVDDKIIIEEIQETSLNLNAGTTIFGDINASDTDTSVTFSKATTAPDGFSIDSETGNYTFTTSAYAELNQGETTTIQIPIIINNIDKNITINIIGKNDAPIAINDNAYTNQDSEIEIDVLANDTDADNNHTLSLVNQTHSDAYMANEKIFFPAGDRYKHLKQDENTSVIFTYTIKDEHDEESSADVNITITGINDAPIADAGEDINITLGESITFNANASDIDGNITNYTWELNGTILSQEINFTKSDFTEGVHTITLTVKDDGDKETTDEIIVIVAQQTMLLPTTQAASLVDFDDGYYKKGKDSNFTKVGDIVEDSSTGVMWEDGYNKLSWQGASSHCDDLVLQNYDDWRLPNTHELFFLAKKDTIVSSSFDLVGVADIEGDIFYWSSNRLNERALVTNFADAKWTTKVPDTSHYTRCIRGEEMTFNFVRDDEKEVVIDTKHQLMWDDNTTASVFAGFDEAVLICKNKTGLGFDNWRLPNIHELYSTVTPFKEAPSTNKVFLSTKNEKHWSSTKWNFASFGFTSRVYNIDFNSGNSDANDIVNLYNVRCVRSLP
jgi:VCBS repeat-containing protein